MSIWRKKKLPMTEEEAVEFAKGLLSENPTQVAAVYTVPSKIGAIRKAQSINLGLDSQWPSDTYWAGIDTTNKGETEVFIGIRTHIPDEWVKFVTGEGA